MSREAMPGASELEAAIVRALAAAREDPQELRARLEARLPHFKGKDYFPPARGGKLAVPSKEGAAAVHDALAFLAKHPPLPALAEPAGRGLQLSAEDHLADRGGSGKIGHTGGDNSTFSERIERYGTWTGKCGECLWFGREGASAAQIVEDLVIDDGVASRGHRLCIFDEPYRVASARVGPHATYGMMAVIEFAAEYETDNDKAAQRAAAGPPKIEAAADETSDATAWKLGACCGCQQPIKGGSVIEVDKIGKFHGKCFVCVGCAVALVGVPWKGDWMQPGSKLAARAGGIHCATCYADKFAPECAACAKKITGGVFSIKGKPQVFCAKACWEEKKKKDEAAAASPEASAANKSAGRGTLGRVGGPAAASKDGKAVAAAARVAPKAAPKAAKGGGRGGGAQKDGASLVAAQRKVEGLAMGYGDF